MLLGFARVAAVPAAVVAHSTRRAGKVDCEAQVHVGHRHSSYYGSYAGDRFGGGIGDRVGIDEGRKQPLAGTGVSRVAVFSETHEHLREWATSDNWSAATKVHKSAYFTRSENRTQEDVIERIRQHYVSSSGYVGHMPVQAALFRCEGEGEFREKVQNAIVRTIPSIEFGVMTEDTERCVVDFANKRLGGGWLSYGMVQEEKMFIERFDLGALCARSLLDMPDPTAEPLASPFSMEPNEAWILRGAPKWAHLGWYGRTPKDAFARFQLLDPAQDRLTSPTVVAIDAIKASFSIYEREHLEMMLIKAYTGFVAARCDGDFGGADRVATGSWGCGAFMNNERVMFVIQALAANAAGVDLTYHILGDGFRLAEAMAFLEDSVVRMLSVAESLDGLVQICADDALWRPKQPRGSR